MEEFQIINEEILTGIQSPKKKKEKNVESLSERILKLHRKLDNKIILKTQEKEAVKRAKYNILSKKSEILNSFTILKISPSTSIKYTKEDIISCFDKIISLDLSQRIFSTTKLIKTMKIFKNCFETTTDQEIKELVKLTGRILKYWNKLLIITELKDLENEKTTNKN